MKPNASQRRDSGASGASAPNEEVRARGCGVPLGISGVLGDVKLGSLAPCGLPPRLRNATKESCVSWARKWCSFVCVILRSASRIAGFGACRARARRRFRQEWCIVAASIYKRARPRRRVSSGRQLAERGSGRIKPRSLHLHLRGDPRSPGGHHRRRGQTGLKDSQSVMETELRVWQEEDGLAQTRPLGLYLDENKLGAPEELAQTYRQGERRGVSMRAPSTGGEHIISSPPGYRKKGGTS